MSLLKLRSVAGIAGYWEGDSGTFGYVWLGGSRRLTITLYGAGVEKGALIGRETMARYGTVTVLGYVQRRA